MKPVVAVLARWWADGPVKTRLAATIGADAARIVYRDLAETVWRGLEAPDLDRHLWVAPSDCVELAAAWLTRADRVAAQPDGDLGARLRAALDVALSNGAPWAAVVGTDAPAVDAAMVRAAGARLGESDVAIVPSLDGGYALAALARATPALFAEVPWSTECVLEVTVERARASGLRVALLDPVRDLDDAADLEALRAEGRL